MADRTFEVNITTAVQAPYAIKKAGYAGEHNATAIQINLPADYIGGFTYSLDVTTGAGESYKYPVILGDGDDFLIFEVPHPLTDKGTLDLTLKITETITQMLVKSCGINLQFIGRDINTYAELADNYVPDATATEDCLNAAVLANEKAGVADAAATSATGAIAAAESATAAAQAAVMATKADMYTTLGIPNPQEEIILTQIVPNGNFDGGVTGFTPSACTLSVTDNVLTLTGNGTLQTINAGASGIGTVGSAHKVYVRARFRTLSSGTNYCRVLINKTASNTITMQYTLTQNTWYEKSTIVTLDSGTGTGTPGIYIAFNNTNTSSIHEVDYTMVIDLTESYGAGNEPTAAQMDAIDYFDGDKTILITGVNTNKVLTEKDNEMQWVDIYDMVDTNLNIDGSNALITGLSVENNSLVINYTEVTE